ncbi:hypothetical protein NUW58_g8535 [Xylaria curta]|uniref:Uncharacterized protein n=1 Tax=Xylaria curta TaxID=42375 RepID=A0ACC1N8K5_9PEZI|nr:hypothetical protein NUW58_g8535 [Xylaria curta]
MVEVMRISSRGQCPPDTMEMDMAEISSRLMTSTLGSIQEEFEKGGAEEKNSKNGVLHVPPRRAFTTTDYLLPTAPVSREGRGGKSCIGECTERGVAGLLLVFGLKGDGCIASVRARSESIVGVVDRQRDCHA